MPHAHAQLGLVDGVAPAFLRLPSVMRVTGLGRSTIYRLMAEGQFPRPVLLASRAVAWRRADIDGWTATRPVVAHLRRVS
jgi:prophage regulatory protein